jgi:uncharacterized membrane protein YedE/YeeE
MNVLGWVILVAVLMILGPVLTIWSLNTLFPVLNIPYSMETWLAVVILGSGIFGVKSNI